MDILELAFALILDLVNKYHASLKIKAHIFLGQIIYQLTIDRKILMLAWREMHAYRHQRENRTRNNLWPLLGTLLTCPRLIDLIPFVFNKYVSIFLGRC